MEDIYLLSSDRLNVTLVPLSQRHIWRIQALPTELAKPLPPEGYTEQAALENLPDYKKAMQMHETDRLYEQVIRTIGASRRIALADPKRDLKEESATLKAFCDLYLIKCPDEQVTDKACGDALMDVFNELKGNEVYEIVLEAYYWLGAKAGGADPEVIEEVIKSLRRNSGWDSSERSVPASAEVLEGRAPTAKHPNKRTVRSGKRSKAVGRAPAPIA